MYGNNSSLILSPALKMPPLELPPWIGGPSDKGPGPGPAGSQPQRMPPPQPMMEIPDDAPISKEAFDMIEIIINVYVINTLSVIGSMGNVMSIIVLSIHGFKRSTNIVLISMAVADFLIVLTMPLRKISLIISYFDEALAITVDSFVVRYHFLTLNRVWSLISNSHIAIIAVERLLAVHYPFQVGRWVTVPRATVLVIMTHIIWYIALIPLFTMFDHMWIFEPNLNKSIAILSISPYYQEREELFNDYNSFFINISVGGFLLLLTLFCCLTTAAKIYRVSQKRNQLTGKYFARHTKQYIETHSGNDGNGDDHKKPAERSVSGISRESDPDTFPKTSPIDMKALKMLMAVCVSFLILIFPTFFLAFSQGLFPQMRDLYWYHVNFVATSVSMLLITMNSCVNFIIYILFSNKFHQTVIDLCTCRQKRLARKDTPKISTTKRDEKF